MNSVKSISISYISSFSRLYSTESVQNFIKFHECVAVGHALAENSILPKLNAYKKNVKQLMRLSKV